MFYNLGARYAPESSLSLQFFLSLAIITFYQMVPLLLSVQRLVKNTI